MTFQPGPRKPWSFEHFAGDSTISTDVILVLTAIECKRAILAPYGSMTKSGITELLEKLAGKRKTQKKKDSVLSRLKKKTSSTEKRALDAAALVAATRRVDYTRLVRERAKIGEFLEKATADYKSVEERMKAIEKDELAKVVTQLSKPRRGFFW
jgi:hypothetical protein